jgi:hypothetical protein
MRTPDRPAAAPRSWRLLAAVLLALAAAAAFVPATAQGRVESAGAIGDADPRMWTAAPTGWISAEPVPTPVALAGRDGGSLEWADPPTRSAPHAHARVLSPAAVAIVARRAGRALRRDHHPPYYATAPPSAR